MPYRCQTLWLSAALCLLLLPCLSTAQAAPERPTPALLADADADGVPDADDHCPSTPGLAALMGCPDADGDGIPDWADACPLVAGSPDNDGCPYSDRDGDGVQDHKDPCPRLPGPPARGGCPSFDTDNDGIPDEEDQCPFDYGIPVFGGCPDTDGDGIEDARDACPELFGVFERSGCPSYFDEAAVALALGKNYVLFMTDSHQLSNTTALRYLHQLSRAAEFLKHNPDFVVHLHGFTSQEGLPDTRQQLSLLRAEACAQYLQGQGVAAERIYRFGHGDTQPLSSREQMLNQRVEMVFYEKGR